MCRVSIEILFTSVVCFFGLVMTEFLVPSEPYHKGGFGASEYELVNTTDNMMYRILYRSGDVFYIGGRGTFYRIDPCNTNCPTAYPKINIGTCEAGGGALPCSSMAPIDAAVDCHNYIRIVEEYDNGKLLVCGTNALEPRCYTFAFDSANCEINLEYPSSIGEETFCQEEGSYNARDLAPRNWNLNYSYLYSTDGSNTLLFTGVSKSTDETDPIWANYFVTTENLGTDTTPFANNLDTYEIESRAVNEANFVGKPYEYTKDGSTFVLFFYRESAVEYINHGKIVYSRVGRVCRDDDGNSFKWSSFLKARLNCSLPDDYPAYFNEIQDMAIIEEESETFFYGVFATPNNGVSTSALCRFRLTNIHEVFQQSKFKSPATAKSLWLPVNPTEVPNPRPGFDCNDKSTDTAFIQNNPLLDDLVDNYNPHEEEDTSDAPLFYTDSGGRFSVIAVDIQDDSNINDNIYYIGTESGKVLKAYNTQQSDGTYDSSGWTVFRYWQKEDNEAITGLEFVPASGNKGPWLYATTDNSFTQIDLKHGKAQNQDQYDIVYFPYLDGNQLDRATGVINNPPNTSYITTCGNRQLNLFCKGTLDETSGVGNITWYKGDEPVSQSMLGHLLSQTHLTGSLSIHPTSFLTVLALKDTTDGRYSCEVWYDKPVVKERVHYFVTIQNCISEDSVETRKVEYNNVSATADYRMEQYEQQGICVIDHPILCEQSCPYQ